MSDGERPRVVVILGLFFMFLNCEVIAGAAIGYALHGFAIGWIGGFYGFALSLFIWALMLEAIEERLAARREEKA